MNALEMLLGSDRVEKRQEKKVKIRRLSPKGKEPVVFTLQSIGWGRVAEIRKLGDERALLHILLAGVVDPDCKNTGRQRRTSWWKSCCCRGRSKTSPGRLKSCPATGR